MAVSCNLVARTRRRQLSIEAQLNNKSVRNTSGTNSTKQRPNFPTFFGDNGRSHQVSLYEQLANDGGTIRFSSPFMELKMSLDEYKQLPLLIFIPGFDGTGMSARHQFPSLMESFDVVTCTIPLDDRTPFAELVNAVEDFIEQYIKLQGQDRPVYLLAESSGALLALMAAAQCPELIDRLVLINPATSYEQSIWPFVGPLISQLPDELYLAVSFATAPFLGNPLTLMARTIDFTRPIEQQIGDIVKSILAMFGTLGFIGDIFTPESVSWRIDLVRQGVEAVNPLLSKIKQRTLVITCDGDWMLPSSGERRRLVNLMPRSIGRSMGLRSHALLLEAGVDIAQIIKEEGFYVKERKFTLPGTNHAINKFGTTKPIELPTEIERMRFENGLISVERLVSPVFYSTNKTGEVVHGLSGIPDQGPVLFVGNHQLIGLDTGTLISGVMREKKVLLRGLAHPMATLPNEEIDKSENTRSLPNARNRIPNFLSTYGAVRVSANNLYRLLKQGERILLYPGGTREAFKLKDDQKYELFWPQSAEFVRMAGKFEATIITVAGVGLEEGLEIVLDREDMLQVPVLKDMVRNQINNAPEARPGINKGVADFFLPPLVRPKQPARYYFLFGKSFTTTIEHYKDKDKAQELYQEIKNELKMNIAYLRQKSVEDPYGDFIKRLIYETSHPGQRAPSFDP